MPRTSPLIVLAVLAGLFVACDRETTAPEPEPEPETGLFGRWEVVRICGGFGGCTEPGGLLVIERPDSMRSFADDGTPGLALRFRLVEDVATIYGQKDVIETWRDDIQDWHPYLVVYELDAERLVLGDNLYDGYSAELKRE